jgi:photosystem II stability/assembly factor-like uncharacterized protein
MVTAELLHGTSISITNKFPKTRSSTKKDLKVTYTTANWTTVFTGDATFTHLSMLNPKFGYASAELGRIYQTIDGVNWKLVLDLKFPYYWYGIHAFNTSSAISSGFNDQTQEGIISWTHDGGKTWSKPITVDPKGWLGAVRFVGDKGVILSLQGDGRTYYTSNGYNWTKVINGDGWWGNDISFLPNGRIDISGINYCTSENFGATYSCRSSIDSVFDGSVYFYNQLNGFVGGGEIMPSVNGWIHSSTDGGKTWGPRILNTPYPIRSIRFVNKNVGFAVGGNYFSAQGGVWRTNDGGKNWELDFDAKAEIKGIDIVMVNRSHALVIVAGSRGGFGAIYSTVVSAL